MNFIDYFKGIYYRPSYAHLSPKEFTLRARALGTHTHLLFRTGTNPNQQTNILSQILRLTAEEITARTTALATHASLLFPTGMDPDTHESIVSQALNLTSEELTARATALATHASLLLPTGMDPYTHGDIVYYALQLTPEEIATYAEAFRTSPHFREQKDPYVLSVIINNIMILGLDSPLMQEGLDAVLRESLSGTTLDEMSLSLAFLKHPNSLYDRVKAAYEERFRNENPETREALIELINPELGEDHPLSKELLRLSSQMDNSQNIPAG